ncbi:MAG: EamA family transporter [Planctomycetota bacterium]
MIWGSTWVVIAEGLDDLPPYTSAGARFALAFLVMCAAVPRLRRMEGGANPPTWLWMSVGLLNFAVSYGIVYKAEQVLASGLTSVLWAVFPLLMALSGQWFLNERLRFLQWLGFGVGFLGVTLLFLKDLDGATVEGEEFEAALLLLGSPFVSAIGQTLMKRYGQHASSLALNRNAMGLGALLLLVMAAFTEQDAEARWTTSAILSIVYLGVVGTSLAFSLLFWLLRSQRASSLSVIAFLTPLLALILGAVLRGEELTPPRLVGAGLVLVGVALAVKK